MELLIVIASRRVHTESDVTHCTLGLESLIVIASCRVHIDS